MSGKLRLALMGGSGRMGLSISELVASGNSDFEIKYKLSSKSSREEISNACENSDIIIDFSTPKGTQTLLNVIKEHSGLKLLVGTTGLDEVTHKMMAELGDSHAILHAPNTSITANLVSELASRAAAILAEFDAEIIESHHRDKKDAPSGTALMIGKKIANARNIDFEKSAVYSRSGEALRQDGEIGFSSIRGGGIYGDNEVLLAGDSEVLNIGCRALDRKAFSYGALKAALWLKNQKAALYQMKDFLSL